MGTREDARELLHKLNACRPRAFFGKIDEVQKGTGFILAYLKDANGTVIAGDLAKELNVSTARIAALLKKLEKNGFVTRATSSEDARRTVVEITPEGDAYVNKIKEQILNKAELLIAKVGKDDLEEFIRICTEIKDALDE